MKTQKPNEILSTKRIVLATISAKLASVLFILVPAEATASPPGSGSFALEPLEPSKLLVQDRGLVEYVDLAIGKSKLVESKDYITFFRYLGADPSSSKENSIKKNSEGFLEVTGTRVFISEFTRCYSILLVSPRVNVERFSFLGGGMKSGGKREYNKLLNALGFDLQVD